MQINLNSVVYLTHICVEHLEKTKGNVINISSIAAMRVIQGFTPYCVAKCALDMFTKCMAAELGPKRIRVNVINPGPVQTEFFTAVGLSDSDVNKLHEGNSKLLPVGRTGLSEDIGDSILYLASDHAAFITGASLVSDGGSIAANAFNAEVLTDS
ncbi:unnamed protein product [Oppiella nova]|uniref:Uncharacterized protein n=1 Tax=Oppiella nova TaxID=334625 RepID=A0A7R9QVH5_9ACAR|nr:unnamed protein product [Oppiella nova]CAG2175495.1 unnamed protein product [Oppiella nova]